MRISTSLAAEIRQSRTGLTVREQLKFFLPLAMTSFLIVSTHSLFNAGLARLPAPEVYISAFAVAKSLMGVLNSPIAMGRQTVAALVEGRQSFYQVRRFILAVLGLVTFSFALIAFTDLSRLIFRNLMGIKGRTLQEAITILRVFMLMPLAVCCRDFLQGLLIRMRMNPLITIGTVVRIIYVLLMIAFIKKLSFLPGAVVAGLLLVGAASAEAIVMFLGIRFSVKNVPGELERIRCSRLDAEANSLTARAVFTFYWPLVITALIRTLAQPLINAGLARTAQPEIAISAFAVAWGLGLIVISPLMMFHQVPLNFVGEDNKNIVEVRRFAIGMALILAIMLALVAFSGLGYWLLIHVIGTTEDISVLAVDVLKIMSLFPLVAVAREFYWGVLMKKHLTEFIGKGKLVNLVALVITIGTLMLAAPANPAIIGIIAMIVCQGAEFGYLYIIGQRKQAV